MMDKCKKNAAIRKFCGAALLLALLWISSCGESKEKGGNVIVDFKDFPIIETVTDTVIATDSIDPVMVNSVIKIPSGYLLNLSKDGYLLGLSDDSFGNIRYACPKGGGPGEISGNVYVGPMVKGEDGMVSVFDSGSLKFYALNLETGNIKEQANLSEVFGKYAPMHVRQIKDGPYIVPRGDFRYGMVSYNPESGEVTEWPLGLTEAGVEIDPENPDYDHTCAHMYDYNEKSGLIAEDYNIIPVIVLHNEKGEIERTITVNGVPENTGPMKGVLSNLCLTDDYIVVLTGGYFDQENRILILTHKGEPVASLSIKPTVYMALDTETGKIITVDANSEERNIVVYGPFDLLKSK